MKYLLDTCTVSDFVKGQPSVMARLKATPPSLIVISSVTRMEIEFGMALYAERARKLAPMLQRPSGQHHNTTVRRSRCPGRCGRTRGAPEEGQAHGVCDVLIAGLRPCKGAGGGNDQRHRVPAR